MIEMKIFGLALDEQSQVPILILKDIEEKKVLPIWIGAMEAMSISISLNKITMARPLTHDLMVNILETMGAKIEKVCVVSLKEGTYFAEIHIEQDDTVYVIDSRPSDAIALAIRCDAKIYANETLLEELEKHLKKEHEVVLKDQEAEKWTEFLERLGDEEFKYKM
ncbi:bifunctional nuclease family protein [Desulfothermus okinawensis JCM 13304]